MRNSLRGVFPRGKENWIFLDEGLDFGGGERKLRAGLLRRAEYWPQVREGRWGLEVRDGGCWRAGV